MLDALAEQTAKIAFATDALELKSAFTESLNSLGFVSYNFSTHRASLDELMSRPTISTWTTSQLDTYVNDRWVGRDPLMKHIKGNTTPLLWRQEHFNRPGSEDYYDYVRFQGIKGGLTLPLPANSGKFSAITLLSIEDTPPPQAVIPAVTILASVAAARLAAFREGEFCEYDIRRFDRLSGAQVEVLHWIAKGKTNGEIAKIIGRTERAIAYHVSEILGKINVASRTQAAAFYAALGLGG
ncbi:helix-turn-helix transcriptional regulator [Martelella limonii]|uniref:helix-turn-helix transcriptional regulator n=1 Tax=Martelella limonii TaxID=1647649 RepID=UPI00157FD4C6|nr:LuxR family transcriptional regulator [Martelella limonii]